MRALWSSAAVAVGIGAFLSAAHAQPARHRADAEAGHRLAARICDACHVVGSRQEVPSSLSGYGPSFFQIANNPNTTDQSLRAFLAHPHALSKMPYPDLTAAQRADVAAYILSLRGRH